MAKLCYSSLSRENTSVECIKIVLSNTRSITEKAVVLEKRLL